MCAAACEWHITQSHTTCFFAVVSQAHPSLSEAVSLCCTCKQALSQALCLPAAMQARFCTTIPNTSPTAPRMTAASVDSDDASLPLLFSSLSNHLHSHQASTQALCQHVWQQQAYCASCLS